MSRHLSPTADNALSSQLELAFEDNRLAAQLYGDFDQHLALIEQRLAVKATPRGNHVMLKGPAGTGDDPSTGDWRFEAFDPNGAPLSSLRPACVSCHATKAANDFVFSGS